jgi:hypothetical protein
VNRDGSRDLPILTDVVEFHATGNFPQPVPLPAEEETFASDLLTADDMAALKATLVSRVMNLTDELLHAASREIESVMFERVIDRLRAALPELVAAALREQLGSGDD